MKQSLREALPYAEAFSKLLYPFAEVVIHDLKKDQIEAIFNPLSRREVGDSSYLDRMMFKETDSIIGPYDKTNWDGRAMKSISILIRNREGKPEGFLCINVDISHFVSANQWIQAFLHNHVELSRESEKLFKDDLYEKINLYIQRYCHDHQVSLEALTRQEKQALITSLVDDGAFSGKNAAIYIGRILGVSRATVYNYLKGKKNP